MADGASSGAQHVHAEEESVGKPSSQLGAVPDIFQEAVLVKSEPMPEDAVEVRGYDFSGPLDYHRLLQSFRTTGFQATNFGLAMQEINKMVSQRGIRGEAIVQSGDPFPSSPPALPPLFFLQLVAMQRKAHPGRWNESRSLRPWLPHTHQLHHIPWLHLQPHLGRHQGNHPLLGAEQHGGLLGQLGGGKG